MNSFKTPNKFWVLLSFCSLLPIITFTSCETNTQASEPKLQKSAVPLKKLEKNARAKKGNLQPKKTKNMNLKYVVIPDKSSEWANKDVFEINKEIETFPPQRELTWEERGVYHDKWNEYLEKFIEKHKQYKAGELSKEAFLEFLGPEPNT